MVVSFYQIRTLLDGIAIVLHKKDDLDLCSKRTLDQALQSVTRIWTNLCNLVKLVVV